MERFSTREVALVVANIMATWGGMVVGVDGFENSILEKREEVTEVTLASKNARTSPQRQITIIRQNAGIAESLGSMNRSAGKRAVTQESPHTHKGTML